MLQAAEAGDAFAASYLLPLVYRELRHLAARRLASEAPGQTLQPTALVHEAYLKLADSGATWSSQGHFFGAAARAMRCILVDRARARRARKRGGDWRRVDSLAEVAGAGDLTPQDDLLELDSALSRLEERDPRKAQVVLLRYFGGLSVDEVATTMGLSPTTVKDEWVFARAWLQCELDVHG